jgi:ABC-type Fe3+-siderophore transport system permease subunit
MAHLLTRVLGLALLVLPSRFLYLLMVPEDRGPDALDVFWSCVITVYGGAGLGFVTCLVRSNQPPTFWRLFVASLSGAVVAIVLAMAMASRRAGGPGTLDGLVVILGIACGTIVAAGVGLLVGLLGAPRRVRTL